MDRDQFDVVIPVCEVLASVIAPSSGVVLWQDGSTWMIDYEGNLHGAANIRTFADRVAHAAGRAATRYPTVARCAVRLDQVESVGSFSESQGQIILGAPEPLRRWLGLEVILDGELLTTDARSQARRDLERIRRANPALAREMSRRLGLPR